MSEQVNCLEASEVCKILENNGYTIEEHESIDELRESLEILVRDGDIILSE
jgi:transcriptional regulator of NAD metabolism